MEEGKQDSSTSDSLDDFYDPSMGDVSEEVLQELVPFSSEKRRLVEKRRLAEQRLEERRLREELGDYNLHLDD